MSVEELLFWIVLLTGATTLIQCIEMFLILVNQRRTNELLENIGHLASDGFFQFINDIAEDKQKEAAFFGFVRCCGQHAIGAVKDAAMPKMPKIKSLGDVIGLLFSSPAVQAKIEKKVGEMVEGAAETAVEGAGWG